MDDSKNPLLLGNQVCFPIYATSRLINRLYQPLLDELDITYTQYLVMLVLWEQSPLKVGEIGQKLFLNSNTLTPLLNKLQQKGLVEKERSQDDERTVFIRLTETGEAMKNRAECIPEAVVKEMGIPLEELLKMRSLMWKFLDKVSDV